MHIIEQASIIYFVTCSEIQSIRNDAVSLE